MIRFVLILAILSSTAFGQKTPKPKLIKGTTPVEFEMVFNFVRKNVKIKERLKLLKLAHKLDGHFKLLPKENLFFFLKSEVYRNIIQYEFDTYVQRIDVNPILLQKLKLSTIMKSVRVALPEFKLSWFENIATPIFRAWNFFTFVL
jgi:hypothetical protein